MDYEEGFYEIMERKKKEVESLEISEKEKSRLYLLIDETLQGFEKIETYHLKEKFTDLYKAWEKLYDSLKKIEDCHLHNKKKILEKIVKTQKVNKKFREIVEERLGKRNILPFPGYIPPSMN